MTDAAWLSCHAITVHFQQNLSDRSRPKNTVILEYQNPRTEEKDTVGGVDLHDAISRANSRILSSPVMVPETLTNLIEKFSVALDSAENSN